MSNGSGEIIIRARSAEVEFDTEVLRPESNQPGRKKFKNAEKKITHVKIAGDINFDSGDPRPQGLRCEITVHYD